MFAELLAHPGVEEVVELRGSFGFMAYHGGSLEEATDVIAQAAAEASGASYYGVHQPADLQWHIPSTQIDPAESSALAAFLDHVDEVITVHGYGRDGWWARLLVGGGNRPLDMISFQRDGKERVLIANSSRTLMSISAEDIDRAQPVTTPVAAAYLTSGVPYVSVAEVGVTQLDNLNSGFVLVVQRDINDGSLNLRSLPKRWL